VGKRDRKKQERQRRSSAVQNAASAASRQAGQVIAETSERVRRTVSEDLRRSDLAEHTAEVSPKALEMALRVIDDSPFRSRHACKEGCAFCCYTAVTVSPSEVFAIAEHLRKRCSSDDMAEVRRRLDENAALAASLSRPDYIARLVRCALLDESNRCRVHPVRPLACAGFLSMSRTKCEAEFNRVPERAPIPTDKLAMAAGASASEGLLRACQASGHDGKFYELHHAVRLALDDPDLAKRWAKKEDAFAGCPT